MTSPKTYVGHDLADAAANGLFADVLHRPCVILGNGPSAAGLDRASLPPDPVIFRMNWFFLEERPAFGRVVHAHFRSIYNPALEFGLDQAQRSGTYDIRAFFAPMRPCAQDVAPPRPLSPEFDHWSTLCRRPRLAQLLGRRPLPTQGLQALAFAAVCGFRDIRTIGLDLYDDGKKRYAFDVPAAVHAQMAAKDLEPGYETDHSLAADTAFLAAVLAEFPELTVSAIAASERMARLITTLTAERPGPAPARPAIWSQPVLARYLVARPRPSRALRDAAKTLAEGAAEIGVNAAEVCRIAPEKPGARRLAPPSTAKADGRRRLDLDIHFLEALHRVFPTADIRLEGLSEGDAVAVDRVTRTGVATQASSNERARRCAFVTFASGPYALGARALARSLARWSQHPLVVLHHDAETRIALADLPNVVLRAVEPIAPKRRRSWAQRRFAETYTKLHAFALTDFDRVAFIDSDAVVLGPVDALFEGDDFAACPDWGADIVLDRFNSGVFALTPDRDRFDALVARIDDVRSYDGGDQGFLNAMLPDWWPLDRRFNVLARLVHDHPALVSLEETRVLHFVGRKPWEPGERTPAQARLETLWRSALTSEDMAMAFVTAVGLPGEARVRAAPSLSLSEIRQRIAANATLARSDPLGLLRQLPGKVMTVLRRGRAHVVASVQARR